MTKIAKKPNKIKMNELEFSNAYKTSLRKCTWGELELLLRLKERENTREITIIKQVIRERRKSETN